MNEKLLQILADTLGVDPRTLSAETSMENTPVWDSVAHLNLVLSLEQTAGRLGSLNGEIASVVEEIRGLAGVARSLDPTGLASALPRASGLVDRLRSLVTEAAAAMVLSHGSRTHIPNDQLVFDADATSSFHTGGVQFLFGDGSVHTITNNIDGLIYEALLTRAGGEAAAGDDY